MYLGERLVVLVFVGRRRDRRTVAHPTVRVTPLGALPPCAGGRLRRASLRGRQMHLWCIRVPAPPNGVHPPRRRAGHLGLPRAAHPRVVPKQGAQSIYNERGAQAAVSSKAPPPFGQASYPFCSPAQHRVGDRVPRRVPRRVHRRAVRHHCIQQPLKRCASPILVKQQSARIE